MKPEQYQRLQDLGDKLTDVVISDADPENWIGKDIKPNDLTQEQRGDAYWCRKMAVASLAVLTRVASLVDMIQQQSNRAAGKGAVEVEDNRELIDEVASAERQANKLISKLQARKNSLPPKKNGKP